MYFTGRNSPLRYFASPLRSRGSPFVWISARVLLESGECANSCISSALKAFHRTDGWAWVLTGARCVVCVDRAIPTRFGNDRLTALAYVANDHPPYFITSIDLVK